MNQYKNNTYDLILYKKLFEHKFIVLDDALFDMAFYL